MGYNAGNAYLQVVPSFEGIDKAVGELVQQMARGVDRGMRDSLGPQARRTLSAAARDAGTQAGSEYGGAFEAAWRRSLSAAAKSLPKVTVDADTTPARRAIAELRARIEAFGDATIGVDVKPDEALATVRRLRRQISEQIAGTDNVGDLLNLKAADAELARFQQSVDVASGRAAETMQRHLTAALDGLPHVNVDADTSPARRAIAELRAQLHTLSEDVDLVGVDGNALNRVRQLRATIRDGLTGAVDAGDIIDLKSADADLEGLEQKLSATVDRAAGRLAEKLRAQAAAAAQALPQVDGASDAERTINRLRDELVGISHAKIGVDVDAAEAAAQLADIHRQLNELIRQHVDLQVDADAAAAAAELEAVLKLVKELDGHNINIDVESDGLVETAANTDIALSRLGGLIAASVSLGTTLVPAAAASAAAVGWIGEAIAGAASGIGVFAIGMYGVVDAVKAISAYEQDATKSAASLSASQSRVAGALDSVASAQRSLGNAREQAAYGAVRAARAVVDAERSVAKAQAEAKAAQDALSAAYDKARQQQQELAFDVRDNALAQRQAALDLQKAADELATINANKRASEAEREQARVTFEERQSQLERLGAAQQRLAVEQARATAAGLEGSDAVAAAQEKIAAKSEAAEQAQQRLADAVQAQAQQQRQGQQAIASATASLTSAQRSLAQAYEKTGIAGGEALGNLRQAMQDMSPAGRRFADFLYGLRGSALELRAVAQEDMFGSFQAGIEQLMTYFPNLLGFVSRVAAGLGTLFTRFIADMQSPTWQRFFGFVSDTAVPSLDQLYTIASNAAEGVVALFLALTPFNDNIGGGLVDLTEKFALWAKTLQSTTGYREFLAYVRDEGPQVVRLLGGLATAALRIVEAAAPIGSVVLRAVNGLADAINALPVSVLTGLLVAIGGLAAGALVFSGIASTASTVAGVFNTVAKGVDLAKIALTGWQVAAVDGASVGGRLAGSIQAIGVQAGASQQRMASITSFLGGPWAVAIAAATIGLGYLAKQEADHQARISALTDKYRSYVDALKSGDRQTATSIATQSKEMRDLIGTLTQLGVSQDTITKGLSGDAAARKQVIDVLEKHRVAEAELAARNLETKKGDEAWNRAQRLEEQRIAFAKLNTEQHAAAEATAKVAAAMRAQGEAFGLTGNDAEKFGTALDTMASKTATLHDRVSALRDAIETLTGANKRQEDQMLTYQESVLRSKDAVNSLNVDTSAMSAEERAAAEATAAAARELDGKSTAAINAQRELVATATAIRDMYLADLEAQVPEDEARKRLDDRTSALRNEYTQGGFNVARVNELIKTYAEVQPSIETVFKQKGLPDTIGGLVALATEIADTQYAAGAITLDEYNKRKREAEARAAHILMPGNAATYYEYYRNQNHNAEGGQVFGPGTATSDSIPAWLSNREFVEPVHAVDYYGADFFEALRQHAIPREMLPGFADGGLVGEVQLPVVVDHTALFSSAMAAMRKQLLEQAAAASGSGWEWQMRVLRAAFPGLPLLSGFRPGDRVGSGELSYHARGRAVDLPPRMDVFDWIAAHYPNSRELIHTPAGGRQIWNGRPWVFTPDVAAGHWDHVHWAYDQGGWLMPGVQQIVNATGAPEAVLNPQQWRDVSLLAKQAKAGGHQYNFQFRDTTLTPGRLRAMQDADAVAARVGRAR